MHARPNYEDLEFIRPGIATELQAKAQLPGIHLIERNPYIDECVTRFVRALRIQPRDP
jgi:hypothetical protein